MTTQTVFRGPLVFSLTHISDLPYQKNLINRDNLCGAPCPWALQQIDERIYLDRSQ